MTPDTTPGLRSVVHKIEQHLPIPDMRKSIIAAAAENLRVNPYERELLNSFFGKETMQGFQIPGETDESTNLFYGLFRKVYDNGINRAVSTKVSGELTDSAPAAHILSRGAFLGEELKEIEQGKDIQFALLDLKSMRDADFHTGFEDESTFVHKPADVIANKFAQVLLTVGQRMGIRAGRYGGDEFVITSEGNDKKKITRFVKYVKQHIHDHNVTGIFQKFKKGKPQGPHPKLLEIKADKNGQEFELIEIPGLDKPGERMIVIDFLKRGLLLTDEQKERIIDKYTEGGMINLARYRADFPERQIYPLGIDTLEGKITYVTKRYPELGIYFELAERAEDAKTPTLKQEYLLDRIENSLFDRLIGEYTYARGEFQHNLEQGRYDEVRIIDLKFVKEMNAKKTYADADLQIRRVWDKIDEILGDERDSVQVSRIGGTYILGMLKGKTLSADVQDKLDRLITLDLFGNTETIVPLSNIKVSKQTMTKPYLDNLLGRSNDNFYTRLVGDIMVEAMKNEQFIPQLQSANLKDSQITKPSLYHMYLKGTRKEERLYEAQKIFTPETIATIIKQYDIPPNIVEEVRGVLFADDV